MWTLTPVGDKVLRGGESAVDRPGGVDVDAEFVRAQAGRDIRMGCGEDIRVDAKGKAGGDAEMLRAGFEQRKFSLGFDIEQENVGLESGIELPCLFANTRKDSTCESRG